MKTRYLITAVVIAVSSPHCLFADEHRPGQFEHHDDIHIELFAAEPDVVDPVSLCFTPDGTCYVIEMRDYPFGVGTPPKPGGTIRLLRDRDGDGEADQSKVFASGLSFPTSVMAWRDGILVLAPPEILFLRDTNGDDRADQRQVVLSGLRRGVTDSNANSLRWGIDNLIHAANGGNGGQVTLTGSEQEAVALGRADFAIDWDGKIVIKTGRSGGGFGLVFDDFGHSFTTHNLDYLQQRIIPSQYLEQSSEMFSFAATENISDHGVSARIYPIVQAVTRVNHPEQAGRFSSAGGMGILAGGPFSGRLANSIFVCDVVCNLVHRDVLRDDGPVFRAGRAPEEQESEFIASRDPAFRPVGLEAGPDGALYLLDMQRDVIEHPDYIPAPVREKLDLRAGADRGRIYRIVPAEGLPAALEPLADTPESELVAHLGSQSRWHRDTAHRLLAQGAAEKTIEQIRRLARNSDSPFARARALWLLSKLDPGAMTPILAALDDKNENVRASAIQLLEPRITEIEGLDVRLTAMLFDPHQRVRFRAALALDGLKSKVKRDPLLAALVENWRNKWMRRTILMSIDSDAHWLLLQVLNGTWFQRIVESEKQQELIRDVADVAAATESPAEYALADWLGDINFTQYDADVVAAMLAGLDAGWRRRSSARLPRDTFAGIVERWIRQPIAGFETPLIDLISLYGLEMPPPLKNLFADARGMAVAQDRGESERIAAIEILGRDRSDETMDVLVKLVSTPETTRIQQAAVEAIRRIRGDDAATRLLDVWPAMLPGIRNDVIELLLSRREYQSDLLTALEQGDVQFSELNLDLEQRRRLLRWSTKEIGQRAARLFGDQEYSNRKSIVAEWLKKLPRSGDPQFGRKLFTQKCATCHVAGGQGHRVGPDLSALSHRSVEDLLTHILDPNMSINPNYVSCVVQTVEGQIVNGLLADETAATVTLKQAEGKTVTIAREDIEQLKTLTTSLMPEGLEKELTPAQMRSLIAYLQSDQSAPNR